MHKPDPIETILARLMPPALSEGGQRNIEAMLRDLAQSPPLLARSARRAWIRRALAGGIAATTGLVAALAFSRATSPTMPSWAWSVPASDPPAGMVLVGESDRIESMTDEGWQEDSDGSAMHALRLNVVEESSLLDEETGIVMQVSQPREEILLIPVSTF